MLKNIVACIAGLAMLVSPVVPAYASSDAAPFVFRYKMSYPSVDLPPRQEKDIKAYFVGGLGFEFSEKLPMKAEWEDDTWNVVSGTLPSGITFDSPTRTFVGIPSSVSQGVVVELEGVDVHGQVVAEAEAVFDIHAIDGLPRSVDLYAHVGKYKVDQLEMPSGVTVDRWRYLYQSPPGITVNGPFFEGTPTAVGIYPVLMQGLDFMGRTVVTFFGKYTVEDGPTFPFIADMVAPLPDPNTTVGYLQYFPGSLGAPSPFGVKRAIGNPSDLRYFLEIDNNGDGNADDTTLLPGTIISNGNSRDLRLTGIISEAYDTATVRFRARDRNGAVGYSNWFEFGSAGPQPYCNPEPAGTTYQPLPFVTGIMNSVPVPYPYGVQGVVSFHLVSGQLPTGVSLDSSTGLISGIPAIATEQTSFEVRIDVTNGSEVDSETCYYSTSVTAGSVRIDNVTPLQDMHVRVGDLFDGVARIVGGIPDYELTFTNANGMSFGSPTVNHEAVAVYGQIDSVGPRSIDVRVVQGDGSTKDGNLVVTGYGEVDVLTPSTLTVRRLAAASVFGSVPYDATTVIPDVAEGDSPLFVLNGDLPLGLSMDEDGVFRGATSVATGTYGPFTVTMSDYSGESDTTEQFNIVVEPRDAIEIADIGNVSFRVENPVSQSSAAPVVTQPAGASDFDVSFVLNGTLPSWASFDGSTGVITASANIPFPDLNATTGYGPFTITVEDEDGSTATTSEFRILVTDWAMPAWEPPGVPVQRGTVSGNPSEGETPTTMFISSLRGFLDPDTIIGGVDAAVFVSSEPSSPAGLVFDSLNGSFSGVPLSPYDGPVEVTVRDGRGRESTLSFPLVVRPYPEVEMTAQNYTLPRLSAAQTTSPLPSGRVVEVSQFWNTPRWEVDLVNGEALPAGFALNETTGAITGRSTAAVGTVYDNIVLKAISRPVSSGDDLVSLTLPFSITIGDPVPMGLSYTSPLVTYYLRDNNGRLELASRTMSNPEVTGSYVDPLRFTVDALSAISSGMTGTFGVNLVNGNLTGFPDVLGRWNVEVGVADAEGRGTSSAFGLEVFATLEGGIRTPPVMINETIRIDEPFRFAGPQIDNYVGNVVFSTSIPDLPTSVMNGFDVTDGSFGYVGVSSFSVAGRYPISLYATDEHDRGFESNPYLGYTAFPPLEISVTESIGDARQFDATRPVEIDLGASVTHLIGTAGYTISGTLPGVRVDRVYDESGVLGRYEWTRNGDAHVLSFENGVPTVLTIDGSPSSFTLVGEGDIDGRLIASGVLPRDAMIVDNRDLTIRGVASQSGVFEITVTARDDHADQYLFNVATRESYNTATSSPIVFEVEASDPLVAVNSENTSTLSRYTESGSVTTTVTGGAYGLPLTITQVSGTVPMGIAATVGASEIVYTGYPTALPGTYGNIVWNVVDAAGRSTTTPPLTFVVGNRGALAVVGDPNPAAMVVNLEMTSGNILVSEVNAAYGQANYSVGGVGSLPPGIVHEITSEGVTFSGTPTVTGVYDGFTVSATDSEGGSASTSMRFIVLEPNDSIVLEVSNITTRLGIPFEMQSVASNTYGRVQFYSLDINGDLQAMTPGQYAGDLNIGVDTGLVSGSFGTVGERDFDVYVTDTTNRLTTRAVQVSVIPDLRLNVPLIVEGEQGLVLSRTIVTDYSLGSVVYSKGDGVWPEGIEVDPSTGRIFSSFTDPVTSALTNRVMAASGTYSGLTIEATDTFVVTGVTHTMTRSSNPFSIQIAPGAAAPDVLNVANNKLVLGTQNDEIAIWRPTVREQGTSTNWSFAGTVYTASHDLSQYGLNFNTSTGVISGTAHTPFIIRDFTIRVTSERGETDITAPFWLGIAPEGDLTLVAGQPSSFNVRRGSPLETTAPQWNNFIGNASYLRMSGNTAFGVNATNGQIIGLTPTSGWGVGTFPVQARLTDEFGRVSNFNRNVLVLNALGLTQVVNTVSLEADFNKTPFFTASGVVGTATWNVVGLPIGLSFDAATGTISGNADDSYASGTEFLLTVTVTDSFDGASISIGMNMNVSSGGGYTYWRIMDPNPVRWAGSYSGGWWNPVFLENGVNVNNLLIDKGAYAPTHPNVDANAYDISGLQTGIIGGHLYPDQSGQFWRAYRFSRPVALTSITINEINSWTSTSTYFRAPRYQGSHDGVNWVTVWTRDPAWGSGVMVKTSVKPAE